MNNQLAYRTRRRASILQACLVAAGCSLGCDSKNGAARFTRAEFDAIPEGGSIEDVRRALGTPFMTAFEGAAGEQLHWCYGNRAGSGNGCLFPMLTFADGRLRSRAWDEAALELRRIREIAPGLTRAAFDAIPEGRSTEEARRRLGAPLMEVHAVTADLSEELHWCYGTRASRTGTVYSFPMLTFVQGKLRRRAWYGPPWDPL